MKDDKGRTPVSAFLGYVWFSRPPESPLWARPTVEKEEERGRRGLSFCGPPKCANGGSPLVSQVFL